MRDMLVGSLGYKRENIIFLVDKPEAGERVEVAVAQRGRRGAVVLAVKRHRWEIAEVIRGVGTTTSTLERSLAWTRNGTVVDQRPARSDVVRQWCE